jgi:hypothetical protein
LTLQLPVGQLAKNPIYSLDSAPVLTLEVGRHTKLFSHTSTRTHEGEPAPDFNAEKLLSLPDLELKTYLIDLLSDQLPHLDLEIHNKYYYFDILEKYSSIKSQLFELLLRLFALQNKTVKGHRRAKKITTTENNFLTVFQLLKDRKHRELSQNVKPHHITQILEVIEGVENKTFDLVDITKQLFIINYQVERVLELFIFEKTVRKTSQKGAKEFELIKKPFSYVA